ncbi:hypothetical protein FACS189464_3280 [Bacteroidia bacterium]|nr:hypothetical protein FACS189430_06560 [Bacteroidia bacterium]GHT78974.1 hypothetical protein FACS189464_3280 [Bacteroidia bacterium]
MKKVSKVMNQAKAKLSITETVRKVVNRQLSTFLLTETTLNALFNILPIATSSAKIEIDGNPGTSTCNKSIATGKGWTVLVN